MTLENKFLFTGDWSTCSKYANHCKLNPQHDCGDLYDPLDEHMMLNKRFIQTPKVLRKMSTGMKVFANHIALIACFISYKKWAQRGKYLNNTRLPYTRFSLGNL